MRLGGVVIARASDRLVARGARLAAWLLESAVEDVEFGERRFRVRGTDRAVDLFAVAAAAGRATRRPTCAAPSRASATRR